MLVVGIIEVMEVRVAADSRGSPHSLHGVSRRGGIGPKGSHVQLEQSVSARRR